VAAFVVSILPRSNIVRLGEIIRKRRRQLELTQEEVARRVRISQDHVSSIESGKRSPSERIIKRFAKVFYLDGRELFFLLNPRLRAMLTSAWGSHLPSAWEKFKNDDRLRRLYNISDDEMAMLSSVASLGEVSSVRQFIYVLSAVRIAMSPALDD